MVGPISPNDRLLTTHIPDKVFEVFNDLIIKNWTGKSARLIQKEVAGLVATKLNLTHSQVFSKCLLDIEDAYRKAGWSVVYSKPSYDEDYEAYFLFTR